MSVRFGENDCEHVGLTYDISAQGMLLRSSRIYPPLTHLRVELLLSDQEKIFCEGGVRWAKRVPPALTRLIKKHGMGIFLTHTPIEYQQFVSQLARTQTGLTASPT